jgi:hypothetical protein
MAFPTRCNQFILIHLDQTGPIILVISFILKFGELIIFEIYLSISWQ